MRENVITSISIDKELLNELDELIKTDYPFLNNRSGIIAYLICKELNRKKKEKGEKNHG